MKLLNGIDNPVQITGNQSNPLLVEGAVGTTTKGEQELHPSTILDRCDGENPHSSNGNVGTTILLGPVSSMEDPRGWPNSCLKKITVRCPNSGFWPRNMTIGIILFPSHSGVWKTPSQAYAVADLAIWSATKDLLLPSRVQFSGARKHGSESGTC